MSGRGHSLMRMHLWMEKGLALGPTCQLFYQQFKRCHNCWYGQIQIDGINNQKNILLLQDKLSNFFFFFFSSAKCKTTLLGAKNRDFIFAQTKPTLNTSDKHSGLECKLPKRSENRGITSKNACKVKEIKGLLHLSVKTLISGKEIWTWKAFEADGHGAIMIEKLKTQTRQIWKIR